jgi:putative phosphotransacetylase
MASPDRDDLARAVAAAVARALAGGAGRTFEAPLGVSAGHVHLSPGDLKTLFGAGASLTPERQLRQPGQFAAAERVAVIGPGGSRAGVRVVGPTRVRTVVELPASDVRELGLAATVRAGEGFGVTLAGPAGVVHLPSAAVISPRHLHASPADAERLGLSDGETARVRLGVPGRKVIFEDVRVRVADDMALEVHVDADEADACGAQTGDAAEVLWDSPGAAEKPKARPARTLITEEDIIAALRRGETPRLAGAILTPFAKDAVRKYFPALAAD